MSGPHVLQQWTWHANGRLRRGSSLTGGGASPLPPARSAAARTLLGARPAAQGSQWALADCCMLTAHAARKQLHTELPRGRDYLACFSCLPAPCTGRATAHRASPVAARYLTCLLLLPAPAMLWQIGLAIGIIVITSFHLTNYDVDLSEGTVTNYKCLLGTTDSGE